MRDESEYMTAREAQEYLGVTKVKMSELIRNGELPIMLNPLNRRVKLIRRADVERLAALPRPKKVPVAA